MMRRSSPFVVLLLAAALAAQGADPAALARSAYRQFQADWYAEQAAARASLQTIQASADYVAARDGKDQQRMRELTSMAKPADVVALSRRAFTLAEQHGEHGAPWLAFVAGNVSDKQIGAELVERLEASWLDRPQLAEVLEAPNALLAAVGAARARQLLDRIVDGSKQDAPLAWARYWRAALVRRDRSASAEAKAAAAEDLRLARVLAKGTALEHRLAAPEFEQQHLQIGMVAPDIEGEDTDGVAFKLSDYRGKVIVLDFWGFW